MSPIRERSSWKAGSLFAFGLFALALAALPAPALAQDIANPPPALRITGQVGRPLVLHDDDLMKLPRQTVKVTDEKGAPALYEGVPVVELLRRAEVPLGKDLRGPRLKLYLVVSALDGYHAVFALPEFDPDFTDRVILLADRRDGRMLSASEGPFRMVVPGEKRHARWVREVTSLDVRAAQ